MPKFGFYVQDLLSSWRGKSDEKTHPGQDIGCQLALRKSAKGETEVFIKKIVPGGSAALSAAFATGDVIAEINGINPLAKDDSSMQSLRTLLDGELGTPVWLKRKVHGCAHVPLIRRKPLSLKSTELAGLGFSFKKQAVEMDGGVLITAVHPGGALWLHGQFCSDAPLRRGDLITHIDGKRARGDSPFKGDPFSRVRLAGQRAEDGTNSQK
jgi:C-terminal processing protease CtpA/Prc